ncbi:Putative ribonuclease H protein At1g65750 [Linum perenne]
MRRKLDGWKCNSLSLAGRVTLAISVLNSIPSYAMQTAVLPVHVANRIDAIIRNFVWGDTPNRSKVHLLAWDRICRPKDQGGLGLRKARELNQAYLMKLGWAILNNLDKLWVQVLTCKYMKTLPHHIVSLVAGMELPGDTLGEDGIIWGPDPRGRFTLKMVYEILDGVGHHTEQAIWKTIWRWAGPSRVRHFLWLVAHDRILTNVERRRRHLTDTNECHSLQDWLLKGLKHPEFNLTFGIVIWILWKARNEATFENKLATSYQLRLRVLYWITEVRETMKADSQVASKATSRRVEVHIGWKAGPTDSITINTDGSVLHPHSHAAAGRILHNHLGRPICTFAANLGCCSIMRAELRAAEFGLMIAWDKGFKKIHLQLDSLAGITTIVGDQEKDSRHGRTLDSINELRGRDWEVTISHTFREGNTVADLLTHHGHTLAFGLFVDCLYPHEVDRTIWHDHVGICFPRLIMMNE